MVAVNTCFEGDLVGPLFEMRKELDTSTAIGLLECIARATDILFVFDLFVL